MATEADITAITDLIPANATTSNKLATIADISGGSKTTYIKETQYSVTFNALLNALGKTAADLPLTFKIDFAGTHNNAAVYDSCIFTLETFTGNTSTGTIREMAKSSSVKYWQYGNGLAVSGSTSDATKANGVYLFALY